MTLAEAVAILNERKHWNHEDWYIFIDRFARIPHNGGLNTFEAIAIAEKYQREAKP